MSMIDADRAGALQRVEPILDTRPALTGVAALTFLFAMRWRFVFFGWMSLAKFGVVLQILGRFRELLGAEGMEALRRR